MKDLTDKDLMPWGKYSQTQMHLVPASYLIYMYDNNKCCKRVKKYVEETMDALKLELKNSR